MIGFLSFALFFSLFALCFMAAGAYDYITEVKEKLTTLKASLDSEHNLQLELKYKLKVRDARVRHLLGLVFDDPPRYEGDYDDWLDEKIEKYTPQGRVAMKVAARADCKKLLDDLAER